MVALSELRAPFPWFGGKRRVADVMWRAFGPDVPNYIEPFGGSLAALLLRPGGAGKIETVNDLDCDVANFWRATQSDPDAVAVAADQPVNEADLRARGKAFLATLPEHRERMLSEPDYFDARRAGLWAWAVSASIGKSWARGKPSIGHSGRGVHRLSLRGYESTRNGSGVEFASIGEWMRALRDRLRPVRVLCGDWSRVVTPAVTGIGNTLQNMGMSPCAVFLDPTYGASVRTAGIYREDGPDVAVSVARWAIENGDDDRLRIAVCGYTGEHSFPRTWVEHSRKEWGGYANASGDNVNAHRERIWFSPHCLQIEEQPSLFDRAVTP